MKIFFNTNSACLAQAICKKLHHVIFYLMHGSKQNFSEIAIIMKSATWRLIRKIFVNANFARRVKKTRLAGSLKFIIPITSVTWSASSVISKRTLSCSFRNTFIFQQVAVRAWAKQRPCNILENLNHQVTENGDLPTSTCYANWIF